MTREKSPPRLVDIARIDLAAMPPGGERIFRRELAAALAARAAGGDDGLDRPHRRHQPMTKAIRAALAQIDAAVNGAAPATGTRRTRG